MNLEWIVKQFDIRGSIAGIISFGGGHINDTYHIQLTDYKKPSYLLQRINTFVFKDVEAVMDNILLVTSHLQKKLIQNHCDHIDRMSLKVIKCKDGKSFFTDSAGHPWRVFNFISDHKVYDSTPNPSIAFEGGKMFGDFLASLSDLNPRLLKETIPHFHNIKKRLENLEHEITENRKDRIKYVMDDILYIKSNYDSMASIYNLGVKGAIPLRITHNDTKINNVLFDKNDKGLCVVDLDTVMPGYVHYDFGDGLRSSANTGKEDDEDLKNIGYDMDIFEAFSEGYLQPTRHLLSAVEINTLADSALLFPFMMGVRFLTDYLAGDVYYKINYPDHNLIRAKAQFKLAQDGVLKIEDLRSRIL